MTQVELPVGWQWKSIGEVCRVIPGFAFKSKDWTDTGIPVIKIKNIQADCSVNTSICDCIPSEIFTEKLNKFVARKGDILIAMTGATAGKVGRLLANESFLINQRVAKLEPETIGKDFFWGVVSGRHYQELFFNLADGAAQPNMSGKQIEGVRIPVPPPQTQEKISVIIGSYDDLIENNTRRIEILEEMARRLYEEWFVQFRFPGHEDVVFKKMPIHNVADVVRGRSYRSADLVENGRPFVNLKCINRDGGYRRDGLKYYSGKYKLEQLVSSGDIVMAVTDMTQERRIVARAALVPDLGELEGVISMDLVRIIPKDGVSALYLYAFFRWSDFSDNVKNHAAGANVLHLHPDLISNYDIDLPPQEVCKSFAEKVRPAIELADVLEKKNANLRAQRDLLLPKLISGEIDVSDIPMPT
ncbi:restriction endonuclease subunit S [Pseudomonas aeruginosa]|nr:restriction endonuclease subunit S [Pseudomonas aeruginosa]